MSTADVAPVVAVAFDDLDDVLTVADVAAFFKCSDDSVYRIIRDGKLATFTIGKNGVRIAKAALAAYTSVTS